MEIVLHSTWKDALKAELDKTYFIDLLSFVETEYNSKEGRIFPKVDDLFSALNACPLSEVKVVILGQDPYPTRGNAHGLCFSVEEDVQPFPKSLLNIFKELEADLAIPFPENGSLVRWAKQGVLLLNAVLTVEEGKPDSHARKGWEQFTDAVISVLNNNCKEVVYLLWGAKAQEKAAQVAVENNLILKSVHPSPLSAYRGFFGCKHFSTTNNFLISKGKKPINW